MSTYGTCDQCAMSTSGVCWQHQPALVLSGDRSFVPWPIVDETSWPARPPTSPGGYGHISGPLHPDLLDYDLLGPAEGFRGWAVRAFFRVMLLWPPRRR